MGGVERRRSPKDKTRRIEALSNVIEENDNLQNEIKCQEQEMAVSENHHNQRQKQEISSLRRTNQGQGQISLLRLINLRQKQEISSLRHTKSRKSLH